MKYYLIVFERQSGNKNKISTVVSSKKLKQSLQFIGEHKHYCLFNITKVNKQVFKAFVKGISIGDKQ